MKETIIKSLVAIGAQIPLLGTLIAFKDDAQQHPVRSLVIALAYELIVVVLAFSKKVWKKLEDEAVQQTTAWLLGAIRRFAPGFRRRYQKQIISRHGIFNVRGLGLINTFTLELNQVFVDLRIAPSSNPNKPNLDPIAAKESAGNLPIWHFLRQKHQSASTALVIIGPPGSGKTTLLQHIALTLAANQQNRVGVRAFVPILLFIRDLVEDISSSKLTLGELAENDFRKKYPRLKVPPGWFEKKLTGGHCLILLDGLDEVADLEQRQAISAWVDQQIIAYSSCRFILTARPQGYRDAQLETADVLEVQPFNAEQVERFVRSWYLANEIKNSGNQINDAVRERATGDANDLLHRLRSRSSLSALTVNPLLLTMVAMVHRYHGALPGSRIELYAEICEVLLGRWRQDRGIKETLSAAQKLFVIRPLAAYMMENKLRDIAYDDAMAVIAPLLDWVGIAATEAKRFLFSMQADSGLLLERESGRWSFTHLTFQEYLTASCWREEKVVDQSWETMVSDSWWHETLRLYAALGDATPVVQACLQNNQLPALMIAADCLEESRGLDPAVRQGIIDLLVNDLESADPARCQLAAEVQLSRRLKRLQRLDDQVEMDGGFVTSAEYQIFLDELRGEGKYYQPDHWQAHRFASGEARQPIAGVSLEDATAFCNWLTRRYGGGVLYRLPRLQEIQRLPAETPRLAAWCSNGTGEILVGLAGGEERTILDSLAALSPLPIVPSLSLVRGRSLAVKLEGDTNSSFIRWLAESFARALGYRVDLNLVAKLARTLGESIARGFDRTLDSDRLFRLAKSFALARARDLADSLEQKMIQVAIKANEIATAHRLAQSAIVDRSNDTPDLLLLLTEMLAIASAENLLSVRSAQRRYTALILEYAFRGNQQAERDHLPSSWMERFRRTYRGNESQQFETDILELYWLLRVIMARESKKLAAWEGIRIVRERL